MNKKITLLAILLFLIISTEIQAQFSLTGEFRPRMEMNHGYKTLAGVDQETSFLTTQRTRLNFNYNKGILTTKLVLQDVRLWGNQRQLVGNEDMATSVHEAWAEAKIFKGVSIKLGRQELAYDDHRIFGSVGWAQQARSHDVALLKYSGIVNAHFGIAYHNSNINNNIYEGPDAYKNLHFLWLNRKGESYSFSALILNNGKPYTINTNEGGNIIEQGIRYSQTVGSYLKYKHGNLILTGNFYHQMGKDAAGMDINANEFAVYANYSITGRLSAGIGYEVLSGTSYDETEENNSFTPFYGTNHKFNGFMDYFFVGNHINTVGLNDLLFTIQNKMDKSTVAATMHLFSANAEIGQGVDKKLGTEIDLVYGYKISEEISLGIGYSHMLATESMELLKGVDGGMDEINNWAYVMFTFKPTFFSAD